MLTDRGKVFSWGCGWNGRLGSGGTTDLSVPTPLASVSDQPIVDVACGYHHTLALDGNNSGSAERTYFLPSSEREKREGTVALIDLMMK
jgi:alpha-tubulin suppressor-like RCC1 family protein